MNKQGKNEKAYTKAETVAWIELRPPVIPGRMLGAFEDMNYEQRQNRLSDLPRKRRLFEVNPGKQGTTIEEREQ